MISRSGFTCTAVEPIVVGRLHTLLSTHVASISLYLRRQLLDRGLSLHLSNLQRPDPILYTASLPAPSGYNFYKNHSPAGTCIVQSGCLHPDAWQMCDIEPSLGCYWMANTTITTHFMNFLTEEGTPHYPLRKLGPGCFRTPGLRSTGGVMLSSSCSLLQHTVGRELYPSSWPVVFQRIQLHGRVALWHWLLSVMHDCSFTLKWLQTGLSPYLLFYIAFVIIYTFNPTVHQAHLWWSGASTFRDDSNPLSRDFHAQLRLCIHKDDYLFLRQASVLTAAAASATSGSYVHTVSVIYLPHFEFLSLLVLENLSSRYCAWSVFRCTHHICCLPICGRALLPLDTNTRMIAGLTSGWTNQDFKDLRPICNGNMTLVWSSRGSNITSPVFR